MNPDDLNKALRRQLRATLQVYKDPSKTPPRLGESIEKTFEEKQALIDRETEKAKAYLEEESRKQKIMQEAILRETARLAAERTRVIHHPPAQQKRRSREIPVAPSLRPRKIVLTED